MSYYPGGTCIMDLWNPNAVGGAAAGERGDGWRVYLNTDAVIPTMEENRLVEHGRGQAGYQIMKAWDPYAGACRNHTWHFGGAHDVVAWHPGSRRHAARTSCVVVRPPAPPGQPAQG